MPSHRVVTGDLSDRELQVVRLVAAGLSNNEIADRLYISPRTVTTHLQHVYQRVGLASRTALIRWALDRGLTADNT
jgi:DNA-binding NarL/FixJ family response regulator